MITHPARASAIDREGMHAFYVHPACILGVRVSSGSGGMAYREQNIRGKCSSTASLGLLHFARAPHQPLPRFARHSVRRLSQSWYYE